MQKFTDFFEEDMVQLGLLEDAYAASRYLMKKYTRKILKSS